MIRNQMGAATLVFDALLLLAFPLLLTFTTFVELPELAEASHQFVRSPHTVNITAINL